MVPFVVLPLFMVPFVVLPLVVLLFVVLPMVGFVDEFVEEFVVGVVVLPVPVVVDPLPVVWANIDIEPPTRSIARNVFFIFRVF